MIRALKKAIIVLIFSLLCTILLGQLPSYLKTQFIDAEFAFLYEEYDKALPKYLACYAMDSLNANINFRIGLCYLQSMEKKKAIPHLLIATGNVTSKYNEGSVKETGAPIEVWLHLGHAYRITGELKKAVDAFNLYKELLDVKDIYNIDLAILEIVKCQNAETFMKSSQSIKDENIGSIINNSLPNFNPVLSGDGKTIIFVSSSFKDNIFMSTKDEKGWSTPVNITTRIKSSGFYQSVSLSHDGKILILFSGEGETGDLYFCKQEQKKWMPMEEFPKSINSRAKETHGCISPDGKKLYFTSNRRGGFGGLDIYISKKSSKGWSEPKNLGPTINTQYDEDTPFMCEDGNTLYFCSKGHVNMGDYDVFYSTMLENGKWSNPLNLGYPINTPGEDRFFVPVGDGKTFFLALEKTDGFGGLDIYQRTILSNDSNKIEIEGLLSMEEGVIIYKKSMFTKEHPIVQIEEVNDSIVIKEPKDTVQIALSTDSTSQISQPDSSLVSDNQMMDDTASTNVDISSIESDEKSFEKADTTEHLRPVSSKVAIIQIKGKITLQDEKDLSGITKIVVKFISPVTNETLAEVVPDLKTGEYSFKTVPGNYELVFLAENYEAKSEFISIPENYNLAELIVNGALIPNEVSTGEYYTIKSILFEFGDHSLDRDAKIELEKLFKIMEKNSSLYVEIIGHTDSKGSADYNKKLSEKRARTTINYLVQKGIDQKRFVAKGVGENEPIALNVQPTGDDSPEGRKYNRRVEIKLHNTGDENIVVENIFVPDHLRYTDEVFYSVFLGQYDDKLTISDVKKYDEHKTAKGYFYTIGNFKQKPEGIALLNASIDEGFQNAKILDNFELAKLMQKKGINGETKKAGNEAKSSPIYTIQLKATKAKSDLSAFNNYSDIEEIKCTDGFYRYVRGTFREYNLAKEELKSVIENGYQDAFVMDRNSIDDPFKEKRTDNSNDFTQESKKSQDVIYTIQISANRSKVDMNKFNDIKKDVEEHLGKDGFYTYSYGKYKGYYEAKKALADVREMGYPDAFIVNSDTYE